MHATSVVTAGIGAVLSPIPLADEIVLVPIYGVLTWRIARVHHLAFRAIPWKPIWKTALAGLAARAAANITVAYIPGVAAAANAATAAALTELFGSYVDTACANPLDARPLLVKDILAQLKEEAVRLARRAGRKTAAA